MCNAVRVQAKSSLPENLQSWPHQWLEEAEQTLLELKSSNVNADNYSTSSRQTFYLLSWVKVERGRGLAHAAGRMNLST